MLRIDGYVQASQVRVQAGKLCCVSKNDSQAKYAQVWLHKFLLQCGNMHLGEDTVYFVLVEHNMGLRKNKLEKERHILEYHVGE